KRTFTLHLWKNSADFGWGGMVYALLNLLFVLGVIYALIKIFKLDKLDIPKEKAAADAPAKGNTKAKKTKKSTAARVKLQPAQK
ncbi:MAG TPA: hypothetical protein VK983_03520, partial [Candidatus Limnocylindrales bacterium]|nr:hypothetical protein [Candidatus Limnocylindrales bacterium]